MIFDAPETPRRRLGPAWLVLPAVTALAFVGYTGCHGRPAPGPQAASARGDAGLGTVAPVATADPVADPAGDPAATVPGPADRPEPAATGHPDAPALLPVVSPLALAHPADPGTDLLAAGKRALAHGDPQGALKAYREAVYDGGGYDAHLGVGRAARALGKDDLAFQAFDAASSDDPGAAEPLVLAARLCLGRGELARGLDYIDRAVTRDPKRADAFNVEGRLEMARQQYDRALIAFDRATTLDPHYVWAFNNAGYVHLLIGEYDQAVKALETATSLTPVRAYMWNNLGLAYEKSGAPMKARQAFDEALAMRPGYVDATLNRSRVTRQLAIAAPPDAARPLLTVPSAVLPPPATGEEVNPKPVATAGSPSPVR